MVVGASLAAVVGWRLALRAMDDRIKEKRSSLKKLMLSGRIPPNEEVMAYLTARQGAVEQRYQRWFELVASPPVAAGASADPQLYFQEQFHEVQRTLERLAAARTLPVPELLGFPKELPPSDTVPRLLVQLSLIQETSTLIFEQGVAGLASFKIEDPEVVSESAADAGFLVRLPVRVRLSASLPQLMKVLGAIHRVTPLMDVDAVRVVAVPPAPAGPSPGQAEAAPAPDRNGPDALEVELRLSRYLVTTSQEPRAEEAATGREPLAAQGVVRSDAGVVQVGAGKPSSGTSSRRGPGRSGQKTDGVRPRNAERE